MQGQTPPAAKPKATFLPDWAYQTAQHPKKDTEIRTPSTLGGAKALPGQGENTQTAMERGTALHLLLEHLPNLPQAAWPAAAPEIASLAPQFDLDFEALLEEATQVLTTPHLAHVFGPDALAEVEITAPSATLGTDLLGVIDRLLVSDDRVTAVDFKTNTVVPDRAEDVPEGILRQMGAYAEMLAQVYPGREIEVALLWSKTATLMVSPHDLVSEALQRARGA